MANPFDAEQSSLEELTTGNLAYAIPLYQRRYVWKNEDNSKLWDDVVECYERGCNHFLGSLVLMEYERDPYDQKYQSDELEEKSYSVFHVVDGQQRLTSLSLILAALYHDMIAHDAFFRELPDCDDQDIADWDSLKSDIRNRLVTRVRDRQSKTGKGYIPRVVPVRAIYEPYKSIINTGEHGRQLRLDKAYVLHEGNIREYRERQLPSTDLERIGVEKDSAVVVYDFYYNMFRAIATRMKIIRIECGADEDAFQVFESLNGTGQRLTSSDRIKNIVMGRAARENDPMPISKVEAEWNSIETLANGSRGGSSDTEAFFSSYMFVITGKRVAKKDLTSEFMKSFLPKFSSVRSALGNLRRAADSYGTIVHQDSEYIGADGNPKLLPPAVKSTLSGIQKNNPSQSVVPLLSAAMNLPEGLYDPLFPVVANALLVLLVRHKVCQLSTNMLDRFFEEYCVKMACGDVAGAIDSLRQNTKDDQAFHREFSNMTFDVRNRVDVKRARYYLQMIEDYLRMKTGNDALNPDEEYTLEHVIPQNCDIEEWFTGHPEEASKFDEVESYREIFEETVVQSIGNMCLLRRPENCSANNAEYSVKLDRYQQPDDDGKTARETFQLVNQIVNNCMKTDDEIVTIVESGETFGPKAVQRRSEALASYALKVWRK
jgi:hypothetical protein